MFHSFFGNVWLLRKVGRISCGISEEITDYCFFLCASAKEFLVKVINESLKIFWKKILRIPSNRIINFLIFIKDEILPISSASIIWTNRARINGLFQRFPEKFLHAFLQKALQKFLLGCSQEFPWDIFRKRWFETSQNNLWS